MKKMISVLLAFLMVMSVLPLAASAAAEDEGGKVRFVIGSDYRVSGIDFSGLIRDLSTVNKGRLTLWKVTEGVAEEDLFQCFARIDDSGVAHFFYEEDGEERDSSLEVFIVNWQFELHAEDGVLFDNVDAFAFSVADIYENAEGRLPIRPTDFWPDVEITKKDGDIVREITIDLDIWDEAPCLPMTLDKTKELTLVAMAFENTVKLTVGLMPVAYEDGKLTLSVRGSDGTEGLALHNEWINIADVSHGYLYTFYFVFPEGLFTYKDSIKSREVGTSIYIDNIEGLPIRDDLMLHLPRVLIDRIFRYVPRSLQNAIIISLLPVISPFLTVYLYRGLWKSLHAYGFSFGAVAKDVIRSGALKDTIRSIFRDLFH